MPVQPTKGGKVSSEGAEEERSKFLSLVELLHRGIATYVSLTYQVRITGTPMTVLATIDTGAQCSALRADVYEQLPLQIKIDPLSTRNTPRMRGVSGEELRVRGKLALRIQKGGISTVAEVWVVEGIQPQLILGLPWIMHAKPQIEWSTGALIFPNNV